MEHRQADESFVGVLGYGILASTVSEAIAIVGMPMHWNVVNVDSDVLRPQREKNLGAVSGKLLQIEADWIKVPRRIHVDSHAGKHNSRETCERGGVASGNLPPARKIRVQLFQLRQSEGARDIGKPVIETQQHHLVMPLPIGLASPRIA